MIRWREDKLSWLKRWRKGKGREGSKMVRWREGDFGGSIVK